jgi:hypothetical protein
MTGTGRRVTRALLAAACALAVCSASAAAAQAGTTITSGPADGSFVASTSATFDYSYSGILQLGFSCTRDGSTAACGSGSSSGTVTYSSLDQGAHTFQVMATGLIGVDATPATRAWTVDTIPPDTTVDSGPSAYSSNASPIFTFSQTDANPDHIECAVDSGPFATCTSGQPIALGSDGPHTVSVRGVDKAGNADPSPATQAITLDTTAPAVSITSGPAAFTNQTSASFAFGAADATPTTVECRLDSGPLALCSGGAKTYAGLAEGQHSFQVVATDSAGNVSTTAERDFAVDLTPPETAITVAPSGVVQTGSAHIEFGASEAASGFACSVDGAAPIACSSPLNLSGLGNGNHSIAVAATDLAGNVDATPDLRTWTVAIPPDGDGDGLTDALDRCPAAAGPAPTGCPAPKSAIALLTKRPKQYAGVRLDASGSTAAAGLTIARYRWTYGDGRTETTLLPQTIHAFRRSGRFTVRVVAIDALGATSPPAALVVRVTDGQPPAVSISSPRQGGRARTRRAIVLKGRAGDASGIRSVRLGLRPLEFTGRTLHGCRWYSGGRLRSAKCSSVHTFAAKVAGKRWSARVPAARLPPGVYELRVIATDRSGLRSTDLSVESHTILTFTVV